MHLFAFAIAIATAIAPALAPATAIAIEFALACALELAITIARVITIVNCELAEKHSALLAWYEACVHFSDIVLLNRREGVFDSADERLASGLVANAAVAMKRGRLIERSRVRRGEGLVQDSLSVDDLNRPRRRI